MTVFKLSNLCSFALMLFIAFFMSFTPIEKGFLCCLVYFAFRALSFGVILFRMFYRIPFDHLMMLVETDNKEEFAKIYHDMNSLS